MAPYASHMSLFLSDRDRVSDVDYSAWQHPDVALRRVLATAYELQVGTARYDVVPLRVRLLDAAPAVEEATHVVEADLQLPSGVLVVHSVAEAWERAPRVPVDPGRHRVRISYLARTAPAPGADAAAPGDHLDYLVDLWPVTRAHPPQTITQGPEVWAG